jgi:hypothetical protein
MFDGQLSLDGEIKMRCVHSTVARLLALAAILLAPAIRAGAQGFGDGPKLVGTSVMPSAPSAQGASVALSADGSTAIVGAPQDANYAGAAWVFTRTNGRWSQQAKLGYPAGNESQGSSVALSADGNTALVGAQSDGNGVGAVWVFTRTNGVWPGGQKLVPNNAGGQAGVGASVALSSDGNTALIGGPFDVQNGAAIGAAWIYTRAGSTWTQGAKLVGSVKGAPVPGQQGRSVALSSDATTALVGGPLASSGSGSVWVFVQSNGSWSFQQRLLATNADESGAAYFGLSVGISADGNTAIVGGPDDSSGAGAAWVWLRTTGGLPWSIQAPKLTAGSGLTMFGSAVSMSSDGNTVVVGAPRDSNDVGAAFVFTRSGGVWSLEGAKWIPTAPLVRPQYGAAVALSADGSTALVGGPYDTATDGIHGAAWVLMRACIGPAGDVDGSNTVSVSDVFYLINFLFAGGPAPKCF